MHKIIPLALALAAGASGGSAPRDTVHGILADYDSELRRPDGRVDVDAMVRRLDELGVNTYFWLIWHAATDWDDLKLFLPKAAAAKIDVWVYLVPPSESPPAPAAGRWDEMGSRKRTMALRLASETGMPTERGAENSR